MSSLGLSFIIVGSILLFMLIIVLGLVISNVNSDSHTEFKTKLIRILLITMLVIFVVQCLLVPLYTAIDLKVL